MISVGSPANAADPLSPMVSSGVVAKLNEFTAHIGLGSLSGPSPMVHEYRELFSKALDRVLTVTAAPDVTRKSVSVIAESVASVVGVPWVAAKAFGHVAGKLVEFNTPEPGEGRDQIRAAAMDAFLIVDSALCGRNGELDACPSVTALIDKHGTAELEAGLDAIAESLTISAGDAAPPVGAKTAPASSYVASRTAPVVGRGRRRGPAVARVVWSPFAPVAGDADFDPASAHAHLDRPPREQIDDRTGLADIPEGFVRQLADLLDAGEWPDTHRRARARVVSGYLRHQVDLSRKEKGR